MLTELEDMQESNETVWGGTTVSFTIETREKDNSKIVQRTYTFAHSPRFDIWTFQEFEEKETKNTKRISGRNWRRNRHVLWNDPAEERKIDIPSEVGEKLKEAIGAESVTIQTPAGSEIANYE